MTTRGRLLACQKTTTTTTTIGRAATMPEGNNNNNNDNKMMAATSSEHNNKNRRKVASMSENSNNNNNNNRKVATMSEGSIKRATPSFSAASKASLQLSLMSWALGRFSFWLHFTIHSLLHFQTWAGCKGSDRGRNCGSKHRTPTHCANLCQNLSPKSEIGAEKDCQGGTLMLE